MTGNGQQTPEQCEAALLAAYDEALAAGLSLNSSEDSLRSLGSKVTDELRKDLECVELLARRWPRRGTQHGKAPTHVFRQPSIGRFSLVGELGSGGFGVVFLAYDPTLNREVALKIPRPESSLSPELMQRFVREAQAAAGLSHPNVVTVYEAGEADRVFYIAAEYCRGTTLREWLRHQQAPVDNRFATELLILLADALEYIHQSNVLHRDLKPNNILLQHSGATAAGISSGVTTPEGICLIPKLTDFGLARQWQGEGNSTRTGALLGTPAYMAPEQAASKKGASGPAADIYSLGAILYEVLTNEPPFHGTTDIDVLRQVISDQPQSMRMLRADLPRDLETICLKCLEKDPARRYSSAAALAADLRHYLANEPISAQPAGVLERTRRWVRSHPATSTAAFAAGIAAISLALTFFWHYSRIQRLNGELRSALIKSDDNWRRAEARESDLLRQTYAARVSLAGDCYQRQQYDSMLEQLSFAAPGKSNEDFRGFEWHYLWRQGDRQFQLIGHGGTVFSVAVSPDGRHCASSSDGTVKLWDLFTGCCLATLDPGVGGASSLAYSLDGRSLVFTNQDRKPGVAIVWDVATGKVVNRLQHAEMGFCNAVFLPDNETIVLGGGSDPASGLLQIWHPRKGTCIRAPWSTSGSIKSVAISSDGRLLAISSLVVSDVENVYSEVVIYNIATQQSVTRIPLGEQFVIVIEFSPDGKIVAVISSDRKIECYDLATGEFLTKLETAQLAWDVSFSPDGKTIAAAVEDSSSQSNIQLWDVRGWKPRAQSLNLDELIRSVAFTTDGERLVLGHTGHSVHIWRPEDRPAFTPLAGHRAEVWTTAFSPDGQMLASGGDDHSIKLWNPATAKELRSLAGHDSLVTCLSFLRAGTRLASASHDGRLKLWDPHKGHEIRSVQAHRGAIRSLAVSPDYSLLATAGDDHVIHLWDAFSYELVRTLEGHTDKVRAVAFSPDGVLATGGNDLTVRFWDIATGQTLRITTLPQQIWCLAYSPNGQSLATGTKGGAVTILDATTGDEQLVFNGHRRGVRSISYTADGRTMASAGDDRSIKLWHTATGLQLVTLGGHKHAVNSVQFDQSGRRLASASHDGALLLWDAEPMEFELMPEEDRARREDEEPSARPSPTRRPSRERECNVTAAANHET